jgi:hypothetical protein
VVRMLPPRAVKRCPCINPSALTMLNYRGARLVRHGRKITERRKCILAAAPDPEEYKHAAPRTGAVDRNGLF